MICDKENERLQMAAAARRLAQLYCRTRKAEAFTLPQGVPDYDRVNACAELADKKNAVQSPWGFLVLTPRVD